MRNTMRVFIFLLIFTNLGSRPNSSHEIEIFLLEPSKGKTENGISVEFQVQKDELPNQPFISNNEILSFDTTSYKMIFATEAYEKIGKLNPPLARGIPFALTVDREPVLTGYFFNVFSSFGCGSYVFTGSRLDRGLPNHHYKDKIVEKRIDNRLIQALKATGRLK